MFRARHLLSKGREHGYFSLGIPAALLCLITTSGQGQEFLSTLPAALADFATGVRTYIVVITGIYGIAGLGAILEELKKSKFGFVNRCCGTSNNPTIPGDLGLIFIEVFLPRRYERGMLLVIW